MQHGRGLKGCALPRKLKCDLFEWNPYISGQELLIIAIDHRNQLVFSLLRTVMLEIKKKRESGNTLLSYIEPKTTSNTQLYLT